MLDLMYWTWILSGWLESMSLHTDLNSGQSSTCPEKTGGFSFSMYGLKFWLLAAVEDEDTELWLLREDVDLALLILARITLTLASCVSVVSSNVSRMLVCLFRSSLASFLPALANSPLTLSSTVAQYSY